MEQGKPLSTTDGPLVDYDAVCQKVRAAVEPARAHAVSLHDEHGDVLWLSESSMGPDEHNAVREAVEAFSKPGGSPVIVFDLGDSRSALLLRAVNGRRAMVGVIMLVMDARVVKHDARGMLKVMTPKLQRALADFGAAIKLNPDHPAARGNYKSLAQELERLGALMAVYNKPSFNCATARRPVQKAICANPELANLDREINAVNTKVVREATSDSPRAGRALQREQDEFIARRDAAFGRPDYDLQKAMRERLDHLLAVERY